MAELSLSSETIYYLAFGLAMGILGVVLYYVFSVLYGATGIARGGYSSAALYALAVFFFAAVAGAALVILLNIYKVIRGET